MAPPRRGAIVAVRLDAKRDAKMRATAVALAIFLLLLAVSTGLGTGRASAQVEPDIDALNLKAAQLYQAQSYAEAMVPAKEALALAEQRFAPDDRRLARLLNNLA